MRTPERLEFTSRRPFLAPSARRPRFLFMGAASEAYKFWMSPDGEVIKFNTRDVHANVALKTLGYSGRSQGDILDNATKDGWIRGQDNQNGELLLEVGEIRDSKMIKRIEDLVYRTLSEHPNGTITLDVFKPRRYSQKITQADIAGGESIKEVLSKEWTKRGVSSPTYENEITWEKKAKTALNDYNDLVERLSSGSSDMNGNLIQRAYGISKRTESLLASPEAGFPTNQNVAEPLLSLAAKARLAGQNLMRAVQNSDFANKEPEIWKHFSESKTPLKEWHRRISSLAKEGDFSHHLFRYPAKSVYAQADSNTWDYKLKNIEALRKVSERVDITDFRPESIDKILEYGEAHPGVKKIIEGKQPSGKLKPNFRGYEPGSRPARSAEVFKSSEVFKPAEVSRPKPKPVEKIPVEVRPSSRPRPVHRLAGFLGAQDSEVDGHYRDAMKALFGDSTSSNPNTSSAANLNAVRVQNTYKNYSEGKITKDEALKIFAEYEKLSPWIWAGIGFVAVGAVLYFYNKSKNQTS